MGVVYTNYLWWFGGWFTMSILTLYPLFRTVLDHIESCSIHTWTYTCLDISKNTYISQNYVLHWIQNKYTYKYIICIYDILYTIYHIYIHILVGTILYNVLYFGTILQYHVMQCLLVQYNMIWYDVRWYMYTIFDIIIWNI